MADDQRPYRSDSAPPRGRSSASGNDPLAELARLIGQTDPFGEFGRNTANRTAAPAAPAPSRPAEPEVPPVPEWLTAPAAAAPVAAARGASDYYQPQQPAAPEPPSFPEPSFGRAPYGSAPIGGGNDLYHVDTEPVAYTSDPQAGYDSGDMARHGVDDDIYDDVPPPRRRIGIIAIAAVFALAVVGTAGAFGYRALFGSSGSKVPPVIKAETAPSKVVPAGAGKDAQSGKLITDRVNDPAQGEKLVSREETPVDIKDKIVGPAFQPEPGPTASTSASAQPPLGSGVVGPEPKKIRTIAIHPDQPGGSAPSVAAMPAPQSQTPSAPVRVTNITPARPAAPPAVPPAVVAPQSAPTMVAPAPVAEPVPPPRPPARAAAVAPHPPANAPLSLSPNAAAPARTPTVAPARTAAVAPTSLAPSGGGGGGSYAVQVSSQRSEAEAQGAYRSLQAKFPAQLGSQQMFVRKVDLGAKGVYYRAMVGPFASGSQATELCSALKAAGGQCLIQKN